MPASGYFTRGVKLYLWRSFSEDKRGMVFTLALTTLLASFTAISLSRNIEEALAGIPNEVLSYVANVYVLMLGFTLGFLSSVPTSSIGSVLHSDRASRFLEVLLSTPITVERYIAIVTTASLVGGFISFSLVALVYTLSLRLAGLVAKAIMLSDWVYVVILLVTLFTSFNTVLFLVAMKISIDLSRLSMIP